MGTIGQRYSLRGDGVERRSPLIWYKACSCEQVEWTVTTVAGKAVFLREWVSAPWHAIQGDTAHKKEPDGLVFLNCVPAGTQEISAAESLLRPAGVECPIVVLWSLIYDKVLASSSPTVVLSEGPRIISQSVPRSLPSSCVVVTGGRELYFFVSLWTDLSSKSWRPVYGLMTSCDRF